MKKQLVIIPMLIFFNELIYGQHTFKNMSPEEKMVWECDHRVFYEIFIRSFYDANGDGIGDLNGITEKLGYLSDLGIGGIWITPISPSPSYHKYDVTNYYDVDPQYGNLDDFRKLVEEAHKHNIYVLMDLVVNHTSIKHPWFVASVKNDPKYRNYYSWENDPPETNYGNWYYARDENGKVIEGEKYFGFFSRVMPDLNYDNPEVRADIINMAKWWLTETGIDGFRLDGAQHIYDSEHPQKNVEWWKEFTDSLKKVKPDVITIGECWNKHPLVAQYLSALTGVFNFELSWAILKSLKDEKNDSIAVLDEEIRTAYATYSKNFIDPIFLSNHDNNRIMSDLDNHEAKARLAASIYLTLPGTPFIYYGEEIGMKGMKPDSLIREPFLWGEKKKKKKEKEDRQPDWMPSTFSTTKTVVPLNEQLNDSTSMFRFYKKLIKVRRRNSALASRVIIPMAMVDTSLLAYKREGNGQELIVIHNLSHEEKQIALPAELSAFNHPVFISGRNCSLQENQLKLAPFSSMIIEKK